MSQVLCGAGSGKRAAAALVWKLKVAQQNPRSSW